MYSNDGQNWIIKDNVAEFYGLSPSQQQQQQQQQLQHQHPQQLQHSQQVGYSQYGYQQYQPQQQPHHGYAPGYDYTGYQHHPQQLQPQHHRHTPQHQQHQQHHQWQSAHQAAPGHVNYQQPSTVTPTIAEKTAGRPKQQQQPQPPKVRQTAAASLTASNTPLGQSPALTHADLATKQSGLHKVFSGAYPQQIAIAAAGSSKSSPSISQARIAPVPRAPTPPPPPPSAAATIAAMSAATSSGRYLKYPVDDIELILYEHNRATAGQKVYDTSTATWPTPVTDGAFITPPHLVDQMLSLWVFLSTFSRPLGLAPFTLDCFEIALSNNNNTGDSDSRDNSDNNGNGNGNGKMIHECNAILFESIVALLNVISSQQARESTYYPGESSDIYDDRFEPSSESDSEEDDEDDEEEDDEDEDDNDEDEDDNDEDDGDDEESDNEDEDDNANGKKKRRVNSDNDSSDDDEDEDDEEETAKKLPAKRKRNSRNKPDPEDVISGSRRGSRRTKTANYAKQVRFDSESDDDSNSDSDESDEPTPAPAPAPVIRGRPRGRPRSSGRGGHSRGPARGNGTDSSSGKDGSNHIMKITDRDNDEEKDEEKDEDDNASDKDDNMEMETEMANNTSVPLNGGGELGDEPAAKQAKSSNEVNGDAESATEAATETAATDAPPTELDLTTLKKYASTLKRLASNWREHYAPAPGPFFTMQSIAQTPANLKQIASVSLDTVASPQRKRRPIHAADLEWPMYLIGWLVEVATTDARGAAKYSHEAVNGPDGSRLTLIARILWQLECELRGKSTEKKKSEQEESDSSKPVPATSATPAAVPPATVPEATVPEATPATPSAPTTPATTPPTTLPSLLAHLMVDPIVHFESVESLYDKLLPSQHQQQLAKLRHPHAAKVNPDFPATTVANLSSRISRLPLESKLSLLQHLVNHATGADIIRSYIEECAESAANLRKERLEVKRNLKKLEADKAQLVKDEETANATYAALTSPPAQSATANQSANGAATATATADQTPSEPAVSTTPSVSVETAPKKRGRPPKSESPATQSSTGTTAEVTLGPLAQRRQQERNHLAMQAQHQNEMRLIDEQILHANKRINRIESDLRSHAEVPRIKELGTDRFYNRYFLFDNIGGGLFYGTSRLLVLAPAVHHSALPNSSSVSEFNDPLSKDGFSSLVHQTSLIKSDHLGHPIVNARWKRDQPSWAEMALDMAKQQQLYPRWGYLERPSQLTELIEFLNNKGIRENKLRTKLLEMQSSIAGRMSSRLRMLATESAQQQQQQQQQSAAGSGDSPVTPQDRPSVAIGTDSAKKVLSAMAMTYNNTYATTRARLR
ncbi:hypothetical protein GQ42DRAFT_158730 [Ramicandelaber brevisporus]|nr:hypothetical protein GQ42DRAFT_158730 [Ramicandelaber brevisporus]